ncbi:hypothetical protein B0H63DRAFT_485280 [Podospora didyma]|uniref:Zn(2)-C6 fungal-type domain-containing protein n=1 Tax=Podospora didyma TaxID=330526 RepID=A0AAE0N6K5_9PEZI|nr:hypothetical protein B0H63DRAFT_485280 [Podospora didyma]
MSCGPPPSPTHDRSQLQMSDSSRSRPRRKLRVSTACDHCHQRRIRCRESGTDPNRCETCADFDLPCTYRRPIKRGKGQQQKLRDATDVSPHHQTLLQPHPGVGRVVASGGASSSSIVGAHQAASDAGTCCLSSSIPARRSSDELGSGRPAQLPLDQPLSQAWKAFAMASAPLVCRLLDVYHETVYPIFPFFDRLHTQQRLASLEHTHSPGFFCSVMAACALVSARVRDGAVISSKRNQTQMADLLAIHAETFCAAAQETLPSDLLQPCGKTRDDFEFLRACGLLAIASIQEGKIDAMQKYIGNYFAMVAIQNGHDEQSWPRDLTRVEREERRRLYWSIYTLDVYSSIVWDGCIHFQEGHAKVLYPEGDYIFNADPNSSSRDDQTDPPPPPWIIGWNFTTDLYRYLEHFVAKLRTQESVYDLLKDDTQTQSNRGGFKSEKILTKVMTEYEQLPYRFKHPVREATGDPDTDIYGFQSANIQATMALLRMMLYTLEGESQDIYKKCEVAQQVLSTFREVPLPFWRAISTPLIYHIASIGALLWSAMQGPLSDSSYQHVRTLLLEMADLLQNMEAFLISRNAGQGQQRLRDMVVKFDEWFKRRLETHNGDHVVPPIARSGSGGGGGVVFPVDEHSEEGSQGVSVAGGNGQGGGGMDDLSPQFQLPDELLQEWTWPADISQAYLPGGVYNYHPAYTTGPYG